MQLLMLSRSITFGKLLPCTQSIGWAVSNKTGQLIHKLPK